MKKDSELTDKVIAYVEVPNFNTDDCVDWAYDMLKLGYESPSLFILAGLSKPTDYFETVDYLKSAFEELNLTPKTAEDGILSYCRYYITKIANGDNVKDSLQSLYHFHQAKIENERPNDFYFLYWAWGDLDYDGQQHYWDGATCENIEAITRKVALEWLKNDKLGNLIP